MERRLWLRTAIDRGKRPLNGQPVSYTPKEIKELRAFCTTFLLDAEADANVLKTDGDFDLDPSAWINWDVPSLDPKKTSGK